MAIIKIHDRADELRIEIQGDFSGPCVRDTSATWRASLPDAMHRRLTVDISEVCGCDADGRKLLQEMYKHGTQIAAGNPTALALLTEITGPLSRRAPNVGDRAPNRVSPKRSLHIVAAAS